jgi:hypothetical protein
MKTSAFEYGPVSRGIYIALIWLTLPVMFLGFKQFIAYMLFLIFLTFALKPILEVTGLMGAYQSLVASQREKANRRLSTKRFIEIDKRERILKHKRSRIKDSSLPNNW